MNTVDDRSPVVRLDGQSAASRDDLGGKAFSVNRMRGLGLPVPPAFALPTYQCEVYHQNGRSIPQDVWDEVLGAIAYLESETGRTFGHGSSPLLVSVRSGAAQSMPGMMDTVLNLGLTPDLVGALGDETGDRAWAQDTWSRFKASYAEIVAGADGEIDPPADAHEQLRCAVGAVFDSWTNDRVKAYRDRHQLGAGGGTAVTVQAMVFGNRDDDSGTGVMFSRNPTTGAHELYGEWLCNAQGEDVVSGSTTPEPLEAVRLLSPAVYAELERVAAVLEQEYRDLVDIEFTLESGRLYMLQARAGKRSPVAAVRVAAELADAGVISPAEALSRVTAEHVESLASSRGVGEGHEIVATGLGASPGVATGKVARDLDEVSELAAAGVDAILVRTFTAPDDVPAMFQSVGVVTEVGGATSHAALVCREIGMPCIVGGGPGLVERLAGQTVTIDGSSGNVYIGDVAVGAIPVEDPYVARLIALADDNTLTEHPIHRLAAVSHS